MSEVIKIKKGLDIKLQGKAEKVFANTGTPSHYAVKPTDFQGIVPKVVVKPEEKVKAGTTLFFDKYHPEVKIVSPVSGIVQEVRRGERRKILEVVIKADATLESEQFGAADPKDLSREEVVEKMLKSGVWPFIRQRPFGTIANPKDQPKAVFISTFDSAPLAPDMDFIITGNEEAFQKGIDAVGKLTEGKVHLNVETDCAASSIFNKAKGVTVNKFKGPHPAGNVGVQIHHIDPVNKGEVVWYLYPQDVVTIGRLFQKGIYDATKVVALTGSEVNKPRYYKVINGACVDAILQDNIKNGEVRFVSGNPLTGTKISSKGHIGFYDSQITLLPEGNYSEMFGWAAPGFGKYSFSKAFFSSLIPKKEYKLDTNLHGGERAFVVTGQYEKVLPMDIYPVHLLKAILANDIDKMENLGIYEVLEEDFALCEFICTSKIEVQDILRQGIDNLIKELG